MLRSREVSTVLFQLLTRYDRATDRKRRVAISVRHLSTRWLRRSVGCASVPKDKSRANQELRARRRSASISDGRRRWSYRRVGLRIASMDVGARREGTSLFAATSGRELLAAFFQHVPPEDTLAVDLDEFRWGHIEIDGKRV